METHAVRFTESSVVHNANFSQFVVFSEPRMRHQPPSAHSVAVSTTEC
ncbi:hypothetical protein RISK_001814 [Rhodopirellula islandica]|uniref:Uncharacterized protein n=1 Tax=Rhodopirellula islandica TaxID=595434 RepID=A0A0J1BHJ0_RHOIS|nr:hypothetical protein RISK_001814 [Rhodopirellula islandica]